MVKDNSNAIIWGIVGGLAILVSVFLIPLFNQVNLHIIIDNNNNIKNTWIEYEKESVYTHVFENKKISGYYTLKINTMPNIFEKSIGLVNTYGEHTIPLNENFLNTTDSVKVSVELYGGDEKEDYQDFVFNLSELKNE